MPITVHQAIDSQTGERIKIIRTISAGRYVDGEYVSGQTRIIKAMASEQPITPEMLDLATGLERIKDMKAFYVNKRIQASDDFNNKESDILVWEGKQYRAMKLGDWRAYGYELVLGARIE